MVRNTHVQQMRAQGQEIEGASWALAKAHYHSGQYQKAIPLLEQHVADNEHGAEAALKLAQAYDEVDKPGDAVKVLERVKGDRPSLAVQKLLGYYLLWLPERTNDAVAYSTEYVARRPKDDGALMNLACGYAQLFEQGDSKDESHKKQALTHLARAIELAPSTKELARNLAGPGGDFASFAKDKSFEALVA